MSDELKHECGIALVRLLKPLEYYKEKYGTAFYGINKMYLMMEKQHNRGQDGAGLAGIKMNMTPGERYISRIRSNASQPIQDIFSQVNQRINLELQENPEIKDNIALQKKHIPYLGELYLGHVRYGTFGGNSIETVHPFLRQNNWMHRNLIIAGNFNMTNTTELFDNLIKLGMHPKEKADTITVMEKIGHFLDDAVRKLYKKAKADGLNKMQASPFIAKNLKLSKILRKSAKNWDGGYAMAGLLGHGDAFVLRDPAGIRPAYYYKDDEVVVVASERPVIQTVFNVPFESVQELDPGHAMIIKKDGRFDISEIQKPLERKSCSFERIYFSRGSDAEIYQERKKLGRLVMPKVLEAIEYDTKNTVFSFIPNTAETSFYGMLEAAQDELNKQKNQAILQEKENLSKERLQEIQDLKIRTEKLAIKDVKLRTFITEDSSRDDLVAHVYDVTYGVVEKGKDNLVVIDDSIVRGTTLKRSILKMLDRLEPRKIIIVSSAPQIRYPDCYGIDMARLEQLVAFNAALALHKERNTYDVVEAIYKKCKAEIEKDPYQEEIVNHVKELYAPFSDEEISDKISEIITEDSVHAEVKVIFQSVDDLHEACPKNLGDWYFTGNYPTKGGKRVVNKAFVHFFEGNPERAY
ncbi:MAG: amidophosphoribosyltransferase [Alteromonas sp.]|nr:amidophosphoribosyltransferase [Alteromonas sp.]MAY21390.1 amidophosphoribosyltransferase [Flavobacteriaceae bacterium]|tara:strand:- start:481 stop:2388 length:1908 start_codon:yes stop_codon:yes gene_type:complete